MQPNSRRSRPWGSGGEPPGKHSVKRFLLFLEKEAKSTSFWTQFLGEADPGVWGSGFTGAVDFLVSKGVGKKYK
jgi:hypothetical protein